MIFTLLFSDICMVFAILSTRFDQSFRPRSLRVLYEFERKVSELMFLKRSSQGIYSDTKKLFKRFSIEAFKKSAFSVSFLCHFKLRAHKGLETFEKVPHMASTTAVSFSRGIFEPTNKYCVHPFILQSHSSTLYQNIIR